MAAFSRKAVPPKCHLFLLQWLQVRFQSSSPMRFSSMDGKGEARSATPLYLKRSDRVYKGAGRGKQQQHSRMFFLFFWFFV